MGEGMERKGVDSRRYKVDGITLKDKKNLQDICLIVLQRLSHCH